MKALSRVRPFLRPVRLPDLHVLERGLVDAERYLRLAHATRGARAQWLYEGHAHDVLARTYRLAGLSAGGRA